MKRTHKRDVEIVVVGSVALDTIKTPWESRKDVLGGSATYACAAASFFAPVGMVGVVGSDFPAKYTRLYRSMGIDLEGLQRVRGKTFRWVGVYERNLDNRRTLCTELNVFAQFQPELPKRYRKAPYVFLANIAPKLQLHVLEQMENRRFVVADTMDLWINTARDALKQVIRHVDMLTLNEFEARHFTGKNSLVKAALRLLGMGPKYVLIKKGEHGSTLFSDDSVCLLPAYPLQEVRDPTGAGDSFAGGLIGYLASAGDVSESALRRAMVYGTVVASFAVEGFGLETLSKLTRKQIESRKDEFRAMLAIP